MIQYLDVSFVLMRVPSPDEAAAPFERLGLYVEPLQRAAEQEIGYRMLFIGEGPRRFGVELLGDANAQPGAGVSLLGLEVKALAAAVKELEGRGVRARTRSYTDADGQKICDVAELDVLAEAAVPLALIEYGPAHRDAARPSPHALPLKRLDHLAAFTQSLDATTRFWAETLGIPRTGEVRTPAMVINQLRIGDMNLELLGAASADSPLASRPPGLASMAAIEVPNVDAAVAHARAAGFTLNDAGGGALPGTKVTTIPAPQLGGIGLQLLQYV